MKGAARMGSGAMGVLRRVTAALGVWVALGLASLAAVALVIAVTSPVEASDRGEVAASACSTVAAEPPLTGTSAAGASAPSDQLDATHPCGGSPSAAQARYEALFAAIGLLGFGAATVVYRRRRRPLTA